MTTARETDVTDSHYNGPMVRKVSRWTVVPLFLAAWAMASASEKPPSLEEWVRAASKGDAVGIERIESRLEPLFARKDYSALGDAEVQAEVGRLLGAPDAGRAVMRFHIPGRPRGWSLLTIDLGEATKGIGAAGRGYVAYAILEEGAKAAAKGDQPAVSWYHDTGSKIEAQGGVAWHPVSAFAVEGGEGTPILAALESAQAGGAVAGALLFARAGEGWRVVQRLAPGSGLQDARFVAAGAGGVVFSARREPAKGVLSGAPPETFRALLFYERAGQGYTDDPSIAPIPDPVSAAENLIGAVRSSDKERAAKLCRSPDVLESMLYFSPEWKVGGRVIKVSGSSVEFTYEERGRPTLRVTFEFKNVAGTLLLASATGRLEEAEKP
jgi:hypothetical protein